jgi:hypothetical protein
MTTIYAIALGVLSGALGTTAIHAWISSKNDQQADIIENQNNTLAQLANIQSTLALGEQEIAKQLTDTDLLEVSCSKEWMETHNDILCREMFCRLQTREGDAASQKECEVIGNIANTFFIIEKCDKYSIELGKCLEVVRDRK